MKRKTKNENETNKTRMKTKTENEKRNELKTNQENADVWFIVDNGDGVEKKDSTWVSKLSQECKLVKLLNFLLKFQMKGSTLVRFRQFKHPSSMEPCDR